MPAGIVEREAADPGGSRRSFLKLAGFSMAAAFLPGCTGPDEYEAVPFLRKPEEVTPGRSTWYATLCGGCPAGCGILARNRDGRPIKVEGNPEHPLSRGRTCAVGQAGVLALYDTLRLKAPLLDGKPAKWARIDERVQEALARIRERGGAVRVLTGSLGGPTATAAIRSFLEPFDDGRHVTYDALSCSAMLDAHADLFGRRLLPRLAFERAEVIVSFDADFLSTWISPVEYTLGYRAGRRLDAKGAPFSRHVHFESRLSLTGGNADYRVAVAPDEMVPALAALALALASRAGVEGPSKGVEVPAPPSARVRIEDAAKWLWDGPRGRTLVVCGVNDLEAQHLVVWINHLLGNYRVSPSEAADVKTLDLVRPARQRLGDDRALGTLLSEMEAGKVDALFVDACNPVYDLPGGSRIERALRNVGLVVAFSQWPDETAAVAHCVCPPPHYLESWADAEPVEGWVTCGQPTLGSFGDTRTLAESLAAFAGHPKTAYEIMRETWRAEVFPRQSATRDFDVFWEPAVHDG
ncbi:MAG: hypothetical protein ACC662_06835, partial [Planctomycetota bacterium]